MTVSVRDLEVNDFYAQLLRLESANCIEFQPRTTVMKSKLPAPFLLIFILLFPLFVLGESSRGKSAAPYGDLFTTDCQIDSECIPTPEYHSGCFHFCEGKDCNGVKLCEVFNRAHNSPLPNCFANIPCKKPERIWCAQGECQRR